MIGVPRMATARPISARYDPDRRFGCCADLLQMRHKNSIAKNQRRGIQGHNNVNRIGEK